MAVLVTGADTINKGGELMLRAVADELGHDHHVAVRPGIGTFLERGSIGVYQYVNNPNVPDGLLRAIDRAVPRVAQSKLRDRYGLIFDSEIDTILDASGFAYSDSFSLERSRRAADQVTRAAAAGKAVILLPQAFGPFTSAEHRAHFVRIANAATLVFVRDRVSLEHVRGSGCRLDHIRSAPDFTVALKPRPAASTSDKPLALVVPSAKMLTQSTASAKAAYLPYLADATGWMVAEGLDVKLLVHERNDEAVVAEANAAAGGGLDIISGLNAIELKATIGGAHLVLGSRFHALVSAMSQGIPAVGVGWSHKYAELFQDYGQPDLLVDPEQGVPPGDTLAPIATSADGHDRIAAGLKARAARQHEATKTMWREVRAVMSGRRGSAG